MNTPSYPCESIQEEISSLLDVREVLPEEIAGHVANCDDCAEFVRFCSGDAMSRLAEPLPPAGIVLRRKVLAMADSKVAPQARSHPSHAGSRSRGGFPSAIAAAIVIGLCCYWLIEVRPAGSNTLATTGEVLPKGEASVSRELLALENDFKDGVSEFRSPVHYLSHILNR